MKSLKIILGTYGLGLMMIFPIAASAAYPISGPGDQGGIIPCGFDTGAKVCDSKGENCTFTNGTKNNKIDREEECTYMDLALGVKRVIQELIKYSTLLATAVIAYAGVKLLASGGNEKAKEEAKEMLWKVVKGYIWILVAWLLIYTITNTLLQSGYSLLSNPTT